jgi:hypothetical protein
MEEIVCKVPPCAPQKLDIKGSDLYCCPFGADLRSSLKVSLLMSLVTYCSLAEFYIRPPDFIV